MHLVDLVGADLGVFDFNPRLAFLLVFTIRLRELRGKRGFKQGKSNPGGRKVDGRRNEEGVKRATRNKFFY